MAAKAKTHWFAP